MEVYINELLSQKKMLDGQINTQRIRVSILEDECSRHTEESMHKASAAGRLQMERQLERLSDEKQILAKLREQYKSISRILPQEISNHQERHSSVSIIDAIKRHFTNPNAIASFLKGLEYIEGGVKRKVGQSSCDVEDRLKRELAIANRALKKNWTMNEPLTRKVYLSMSDDEQRCVVMTFDRINIEKSRLAYMSYMKKKAKQQQSIKAE